MQYKVSVIIPCYNSETTLKRCIDSVINQTLGFENIELIIYYDASKDSKREIIQYYEKKYENVIPIYSNENSGSPVAGRNKGMEIASSEYIMFMDNDDEYNEDICQRLYNYIEKENVDLVGCNYCTINNFGIVKGSCYLNVPHYENLNESILIKDDNIIFFSDWFIWNKIFKKSIIEKNNIKFPDKHSEDLFFCIEYFAKINSLIYIENYYGYKRHSSKTSLSTNINVNYLIETIDVFSELQDLLESHIPDKYDDSYKFNLAKQEITYTISVLPRLKRKDELYCIKYLYEFEKKISYNQPLKFAIHTFINSLIQKKLWHPAMWLINMTNRLINSKLQNIYTSIKRR